jgi:LPS O-antigen subunit length determinant protein (WzzB/FepE family)
MRNRTGVLPKDYKHPSQSKTNSEDLKELARTILAAIVMVVAVCFCFLAAATAPEPQAQEPVTRKGGRPS